MVPLLLQDWATLRGTAAVTQSEFGWLDTSGFLDLVTWLEVSEISAGTLFCAFQTAPTKDETLFTAMNNVDATSPSAVPITLGLQVGVYLRDTALCPLSHWLRWQIQNPGGQAWDLTFGCSSHRDVFARRGLRSGFGVMSMTLAST